MLRRVARWMAGGAVIVVVVAALLIAALRLLIANGMRIEGPAAVQESGYVTIGGQPQWIELRGWDRANPAMLQSEAFLKALVENVRPNAITTSR